MANKNSHNAAFVTGAVLGGLVGAAVALWKTPYSGEELRARLTGGEPGGEATNEPIETGRLPEPGLKDRVIAAAENLLAPLVGVDLNKTANGLAPESPGASTQLGQDTTMLRESAEYPSGEPSTSPDDAGTSPDQASRQAPPAGLGEDESRIGGDDPDKDTLADYGAARTGAATNMTPVDEAAKEPDRTSSASVEPASEPASVEDLTTPQTDDVPDALKHEHHEMQPFPKLGGTEKR